MSDKIGIGKSELPPIAEILDRASTALANYQAHGFDTRNGILFARALIASGARATALEKEVERMRAVLDVCHRGIDSLWNAYHSGAWELNHHHDKDDRPCPEDDTCECEGREAATLLSKASGMLTSWSRIDAAKESA